MRNALMISGAAMLAIAGAAQADFLITSGNAAFNPSFTGTPWPSSLSNTTRPYQWNTSSGVTGAEAKLYPDAPGAFTASNLGDQPLRSFRWGFRNAGGSNGGTAGKGLSGTAGGLSTYSQSFTAGADNGTINWVDVFESSRSRIDASIKYTITDGASAGQALVKAEATFTNRAAGTETYDFFNLVDSQIGGIGAGSNDIPTASVSGIYNTLSFTDGPNVLNFIAENPSRWEVNIESQIQSKTFSGAGNTPTQYAGVGGSTSGVIVAATGDRFGAFSWRVTLAPGASVTLVSYIGLNQIPAPGALALFGLGGLAAARRRR